MAKITINIKNYEENAEIIRTIFAGVEEQFLNGVTEGKFDVTDKIKIEWKFRG